MNQCELNARAGAYNEARTYGASHKEAVVKADAYMKRRIPCAGCLKEAK